MLSRNRLALLIAAIAAVGAAPALGQPGCVTIFDRVHCPGTDTTLDIAGGVLIVSAPDDTPLVRVECPGELRFVVKFDPIVFPSDRNSAANYAAVGVINGTPDLTVGTIFPDYDFNDQEFTVFGSLAGLASFIQLEVYDDGILVGTHPVFDAAIRAKTTSTIPEVASMGLRTDGIPRMVITFTSDADWTVGAFQATGDELRFVQTTASRTLDALEYALVETVFINSFTIEAEIGSNPELTIDGPCPGPATLTVTDATPNGTVAIVAAAARGSVIVPSGPCAGMTLGLNASARLMFAMRADGSGVATAPVNLPAFVCDRAVAQAVDLQTCTTSNTAAIR